MHPDERLYLLLDRYLAGEASAGDAQAVRDWVAGDPEHARLDCRRAIGDLERPRIKGSPKPNLPWRRHVRFIRDE
jgi:hypothetical protein